MPGIVTWGSVTAEPVLSQTSACPIDWSKVKGIEDMHKDVYILRSPWKPAPDKSMENIKIELNQLHNLSIGTEAWRKKFMKANKQVFLCTGKYWAEHWIGIESLVGKPSKAQQQAAHAKGKSQDPGKYTGEVFTFHIVTDDQVVEETRLVPLAEACEASIYIKETVRKGHTSVYVPSSTKIIDLWIACILPGRRSKIPTLGQRLTQDDDEGIRMIEFATEVTIADLAELYIFCAPNVGIGSIDVQDLIIDHWRGIHLYHLCICNEYATGLRKWTDVPAQPVQMIMDFEPVDMNYLWQHTVKDDPVRMFWLDVLEMKKEQTIEKINKEYEEENGYSRDFLEDLYRRFGFKVTENVEGKLPDGFTVPYNATNNIIGYESDFFRHDPRILVDGSQEKICLLYHNHSRADQPCYDRPCYKILASGMHVKDEPGKKIGATSSAVTMTIGGIPGFSIHNYTGSGIEEFRELPYRFPEWDWPRVRAIHTFQQCTHVEAMCLHPEIHPVLWPRPILFDEGYKKLLQSTSQTGGRFPSQDEEGRWPSHPGYGIKGWTPALPSDNGISVHEAGNEDRIQKEATPALLAKSRKCKNRDDDKDSDDADAAAPPGQGRKRAKSKRPRTTKNAPGQDENETNDTAILRRVDPFVNRQTD
jgi:hypothetical protein